MVHILRTPVIAKEIKTDICPDCKRRSRFIVFFYLMYGPSSTCLNCGRRWSGGEWMRLPFERSARKNSIESAKTSWRVLEGMGIGTLDDVNFESLFEQESNDE